MVTRIVSGLRWLLLLAAVGGPVIAYLSWDEANRLRDVQANGIAAEASIEGATETKRRRGGTSYSLTLAWTDAKGQSLKADDVSISDTYAGKIIVDGKINASTVGIKYMAGSPQIDPILVDDVAEQIETDDILMQLGIAAGIIGLLGFGLMFRLGRRRQAVEVEA